jgi:hypothetical protein
MAAGALAPGLRGNGPAPGVDIDTLRYGKWAKDDAGLPCFDADLERNPAPYVPFTHLLSTGTAGALVDQWGNVKLITTEAGTVSFTPSSFRTRSGLYPMLELDGQLYGLVYSELNRNKSFRYGTGYAAYRGELETTAVHLAVEQEVFTPPDKDRAVLARITFRNLGHGALTASFSVRSDVFARPGPNYPEYVAGLRPAQGDGFALFGNAHAALGDVFLIADRQWTGSSRAHNLALSRRLTLAPGESVTVPVMLGYGKETDVAGRQSKLARITPAESRRMWAQRLSRFSAPCPEQWMRDECIWTLGQLFAFENYDGVLDEHYIHLGGYGFFPDPDHPMPGQSYGVRETAEDVLVMAYFDPELARSSLRWLAKMQLSNGDIPKAYAYTSEKGDPAAQEKESDTEIWFLMALCEYAASTGDTAFLDAGMWEHARLSFEWITKGIGVGRHGLILIRDGDWNDYFSTVGARGEGESVMNSGMAARAFDGLARLARKRGDTAFAVEVEGWRDSLRAAVGKAFDREWFVGCYTDDGLPMCGYGDRLYLNSQSWAVLGKCGTPEQRRKALRSAVDQCGSRIGLMLMSRPYSSPAPPEISVCPISAGEGENCGVWPQTIYWTVWAMAEEGMVDLALQEWKKGSLRNHATTFPDVPYGIFNGPDCYSSRFAGPFEGWTQYQLFNRLTPSPMNPIVAWQAFAMQKIAEAKA